MVLTVAALAAGVGLPACGAPERAVKPTLPPPASQPLTRPFFWRIDARDHGDATGEPSYLLGTMHIGVDPYEVLPRGIWEKFDASRTLVMEVDTTGPETLGLGKQPEGMTLERQMSPEQWALFVQKLDLDDDEAEQISQLQAWMVVVQMTQTLAPDARSIEDVLHQRAIEQSKQMGFLEPIDAQSSLLKRFIDIDYLIEFISDLPKQKRSLAQQAEIYRQGDEEALYQRSIVGMQKHIGADGMNTLVYDRNRAWIPLLEQRVASGNAFIIVGASHLVGPDSVIDLLSRAGYSLTRIVE